MLEHAIFVVHSPAVRDNQSGCNCVLCLMASRSSRRVLHAVEPTRSVGARFGSVGTTHRHTTRLDWLFCNSLIFRNGHAVYRATFKLRTWFTYKVNAPMQFATINVVYHSEDIPMHGVLPTTMAELLLASTRLHSFVRRTIVLLHLFSDLRLFYVFGYCVYLNRRAMVCYLVCNAI